MKKKLGKMSNMFKDKDQKRKLFLHYYKYTNGFRTNELMYIQGNTGDPLIVSGITKKF